MSSIAVRIESLSKRYHIGRAQQRYPTLRDGIVDTAARTVQRLKGERSTRSDDVLWALKGVSFDVEPGEVVGIIGRNGAGKSTLLKILSRITEPTEGRLEVRGRVGSLLEVGTGFHPELTGRENIFLNGAILGMKRAEIQRKFDEIVAFADVERFLDTPVKRYSSGMYVRLAFAVAAHLAPDVLLIDEVLSVGDAAFQKKCLGKIGDVSRSGRTVIFVSHNMQAVTTLCTRAVHLSHGEAIGDGEAAKVVREYMLVDTSSCGEVVWPESSAPGDDLLRLRAVRLLGENAQPVRQLLSSQPVRIQLEFDLTRVDSALVVGFDLGTPEGIAVMRCYHNDAGESSWPELHPGRNCIECELPAGLLNAGTYVISPRISLHCTKWIVALDSVLMFEVEVTHGVSAFWNALTAGSRPGVISPILPWKVATPRA